MASTVTRIHYEIDEDLHRRAKAAAAMRGQTLKAFIAEALEAAITAQEAARGTADGGR